MGNVTPHAPETVLDPAAFPCLYGCSDPLTCDYRHSGCEHCAAIRATRVKVKDPDLADPDDEC